MKFEIIPRPFNKGFVIRGLKASDLSLRKTFKCGQAFRWREIITEEGVEGWQGVIGNNTVRIYCLYNIGGEYEIVTDFPAERAGELVRYLSLDIDYGDGPEPGLDGFTRNAYEYGSGIRILRQDPWETVVTFIISQRNSVERIAKTVERICVAYNRLTSDRAASNRRRQEYTFPRPEEIYKKPGLLYTVGLGYRADYIMKLAKNTVERGNVLFTPDAYKLSTESLERNLLEIYGVGPKVANCALLFAYSRYEVFPIDTWIQKVIDKYYGGRLDISKFGRYPGLYQQYIYYYVKFLGGL